MTDNNHIQLWEKCRGIIRDNLPPEQYDAWFKDITSYAYADNVLSLNVPSPYYVEYLEEKYLRILKPAIQSVYGPSTDLCYRYYQINGQADTAVNMRSENPSRVILDRQKAQPANPFQSQVDADLDSQLNPRYTFENYCMGESNKIARAIGQSIADNPKMRTFNPLFVFGPTGVGKTHLIQAIGIRIKEQNPSARVLYVTSRLFESQYTAAVAKKEVNSFCHFYQSIDTLIIDDIQDLIGKPGTQSTFFFIFNHLHQNNKQIIMSSDCAPAEMEGFEARLLNRFKWGMAAELGLPDLDLRRQVLHSKARQNGLDISEDVIEYIAATVTTSIRELEGVVVSLIAHATINNCDITLDLARSVVEHAVKMSRRTIDFELIAQEVSSYYNIDCDLLFTKTRKREVSDARQVVMYLAKKLAKMPIVSIGNRISRTHATVNYACKSIEERLPLDKQLQTDITAIQESIMA